MTAIPTVATTCSANRIHCHGLPFSPPVVAVAFDDRAASLKLLIDLPCLLDFLNGLLKEPSNGFVGGPGHLIQLTLCPCRERFTVCIAKRNGEFL